MLFLQGTLFLRNKKLNLGPAVKKQVWAVSLEIFHYQVLNLPIDGVSIHSVFESLLKNWDERMHAVLQFY